MPLYRVRFRDGGYSYDIEAKDKEEAKRNAAAARRAGLRGTFGGTRQMNTNYTTPVDAERQPKE